MIVLKGIFYVMIKQIFGLVKKYYYVILCAISLVLPDILMRSCVSPGVFDGAYAGTFSVLFTVGWIGAVLFLCIGILPGKWGRLVFGIINLAMAVLAFCECVYYRIFQQFFWLSGIGLAGEGQEYFGYALQCVDKWLIMYAVAVFVFMVWGMIKWETPSFKLRTKIISVLAPLVVVALSHICMQPWVCGESADGWDMWRKPAVVYSSFNDINKSVELTGLYQFVFRSGCEVVLPQRACSASQTEVVDTYLGEKEAPSANSYTGIFEGKNVIAVMMESMDTWMIDRKHTPNLYKMMRNGIRFTNYNAPFFGTGFTFSSEFAFNTGLFAPSSSVSASNFGKNSFPYAVAKLFADKGYSTNSFHYNSREFYNRGTMHKSFGYDMYYSVGDFGIEGTEAELDSNMIENDELYHKITEGNPFFSFVITYSAHLPYTGDSAKLQLAKECYPELVRGDDELNNIRILAADTDRFFGRLIERLDEDGLLDDTVIVAFTDHFAYGVSDEALLKEWKGDTLKYTVPAFIYSPGITPVRIDKPMMTVDWAPTLVNLFGLGSEGKYLGNDIMDPDNEGFVYFETRDWMDGTLHYVQSEKKAPAEHLVRIIDNNRKVRKLIEVNDIIVTGDYYKLK